MRYDVDIREYNPWGTVFFIIFLVGLIYLTVHK